MDKHLVLTSHGSNPQHLQIITRGLTFSLPDPPFFSFQTLIFFPPSNTNVVAFFFSSLCVLTAFHFQAHPTVKVSTSELNPALLSISTLLRKYISQPAHSLGLMMIYIYIFFFSQLAYVQIVQRMQLTQGNKFFFFIDFVVFTE